MCVLVWCVYACARVREREREREGGGRGGRERGAGTTELYTKLVYSSVAGTQSHKVNPLALHFLAKTRERGGGGEGG